MPLEKPGGWYVGATFKTGALIPLFSEAPLGLDGMVALIKIISGPAATNPDYDIADHAMLNAMRVKPDGTWVGPSAPGRVERIHGFRRVPGRDLAMVVAVDRHERSSKPNLR